MTVRPESSIPAARRATSTPVAVRSTQTTRVRLATAVAVALAAVTVSPAWAGKGNGGSQGAGQSGAAPGIGGAKVARGSASFAQTGPNNTVITASNRAVIDYAKFDVPVGGGVQFVQPSATATVLNRINGGSPSRIDGTLTANGRVFFVNPTGVVFGPNAEVKTAGFTAAAANISNDDFLRGVYRFTGASGAVVNDGRISVAPGGQVNLFGTQVTNGGTITAPGGLVTMTAGSGVTYVGEAGVGGGASVAVKVDPAVGPVGPAAGATGDVFALAIRRGGSVKAKDVVVTAAPGAGFVKVEGAIDASSDKGVGGSVAVTGDRVGVLGGTIDASGPAGGGSVRVGGDFRGGGTLAHSTATVIDATSSVRADATAKGDGGSVVVWSDADTRVRGTVSARGGPAGGNGGRVETSGGHLDIAGATVRVDAPGAPTGGGTGGSWLLDPTFIIIRSAANFAARDAAGLDTDAGPLVTTLTDADVLAAGIQYRPNASLATSRLTTEAIAAQLNQGVDVTVDASFGPRPLQTDAFAGVIAVNDVITKTQMSPAEVAGGPAPTLTLYAPRLVRFNGAILENNTTPVNEKGGIAVLPTAGKLNVVLQVQDRVSVVSTDPTQNLPSSQRFGQIIMNGDGIRTNGGSFTARVVDAAGVAIVQPAPNLPSTNDRTNNQINQFVTSPSDPNFLLTNNLPGTLGVGGLIDTSAANGTRGGDFTVDIPRSVVILSPVLTGGGNVNVTTSGPIGLGNPQITSTPLVIPGVIKTGGGDVTLRSTFDLQVRSIDSGGGDVNLIADTIKTGQLNGAGTAVTNRSARGKVTILPQEVGFGDTASQPTGVDAGDGKVTIDGFQLITRNDIRGRGGVSINADPRDTLGVIVNGGSVIQFAGTIDAGKSPLTITGGQAIVLAGQSLRGSDISLSTIEPTADPAAVAGNEIHQILVAQDDYRIVTSGGTVRFNAPVLAANSVTQTAAGDSAPISINPGLDVSVVPGASADVTFARTVGGPLALHVDAGPQGSISFNDAVGRAPQILGSPGSGEYVEAPYAIASVDLTAKRIAFGADGETPPTYAGLTLREGTLIRNGVLVADSKPGSTGDVLATGPIKLHAERILVGGRGPEIVSGTRIEATSGPIDRARGAAPAFAVPGGAKNAVDTLVGRGFDIEGSRLFAGQAVALITPASGGSPFGINGGAGLPTLMVPGAPKLTGSLTPVSVRKEFAPQSVAEVIAGATPPVIRRADRAAAPSGSQVAALQNLGINARPAKLMEEMMDAAMTGRASYDDFEDAMAKGYPIAAPRISAAQASFALSEYRALLADVKPRQDALGAEWEKYQNLNEGQTVTGGGFRKYLDAAAAPTPQQAKAAETLRRLQRLQAELALNPVYREKAERAIASAFRPGSIPLVKFRSAISGVDPVVTGAAE